MMYHDLSVNFTTVYPEVTPVITNYYKIPNSFPLGGLVKSLVQISVESESFFTDFPVKTKILVTGFEVF